MAPYLIAHKVRGAPAFDVAERFTCPECSTHDLDANTWTNPTGCDECEGLGYWWIVSTSGARAHPGANWLIEELFDASDYPHSRPTHILDKLDLATLPDHYPANPSPKAKLGSLLEALGLKRPQPKIVRRL